MATIKQKLVASKLLENKGSVSAAMRSAGYSSNYSKNPQQLTSSKAWPMLMEKYLSDEKLARVAGQGLRAKKHYKGEQEPDHYIRHMFLETSLKLKNKFPKEQTGYQEIPITLNVYGNNKRLTGRIDRLHATDTRERETVPGTELAQEGTQDHVSGASDGNVDNTNT